MQLMLFSISFVWHKQQKSVNAYVQAHHTNLLSNNDARFKSSVRIEENSPRQPTKFSHLILSIKFANFCTQISAEHKLNPFFTYFVQLGLWDCRVLFDEAVCEEQISRAWFFRCRLQEDEGRDHWGADGRLAKVWYITRTIMTHIMQKFIVILLKLQCLWNSFIHENLNCAKQ